MELGSVAELLSAFGTLAALVAASIAARAAIKTNDQQGRQLQYLERANMERQRDLEAAQAAKIAVWIQQDEAGAPHVWWLNASGLPIYSSTFTVTSPLTITQVKYSIRGPGGKPYEVARVSRKFLSDAEVFNSSWSDWFDQDALHVAISFRDASGHWWLRDFSGFLLQYDSEESVQRAMSDSIARMQGQAPS